MGIIAALAIGAGVAGISAAASNKSERKAGNASRDAALEQQRLQDELKNRSTGEESSQNKNAARDQAALKQRQAAAAATGRNSTILTSPLGVTGNNPNDQQKTLLGS